MSELPATPAQLFPVTWALGCRRQGELDSCGILFVPCLSLGHLFGLSPHPMLLWWLVCVTG